MAANTHEILKRARHRDVADLVMGVSRGIHCVTHAPHLVAAPPPPPPPATLIDEYCTKLTFVPGQNHGKVEPHPPQRICIRIPSAQRLPLFDVGVM